MPIQTRPKNPPSVQVTDATSGRMLRGHDVACDSRRCARFRHVLRGRGAGAAVAVVVASPEPADQPTPRSGSGPSSTRSSTSGRCFAMPAPTRRRSRPTGSRSCTGSRSSRSASSRPAFARPEDANPSVPIGPWRVRVASTRRHGPRFRPALEPRKAGRPRHGNRITPGGRPQETAVSLDPWSFGRFPPAGPSSARGRGDAKPWLGWRARVRPVLAAILGGNRWGRRGRRPCRMSPSVRDRVTHEANAAGRDRARRRRARRPSRSASCRFSAASSARISAARAASAAACSASRASAFSRFASVRRVGDALARGARDLVAAAARRRHRLERPEAGRLQLLGQPAALRAACAPLVDRRGAQRLGETLEQRRRRARRRAPSEPTRAARARPRARRATPR